MREVLLHGGMDEAFDRSIVFARRLAESFGARLHVLYTVEDPLSAGWTAEMSADRLPEVHEAMEIEARQIALGTGPADEEVVRYANEHAIDLVIVQARTEDAASSDFAQAVLAGARSAVLVLR